MAISKLEEIGNAERNKLFPGNIYNSSDEAKNYSAIHPNAIAHDHGSDDPRDLKGKGTGIFLDTNPDKAKGAGGHNDIYGSDFDIASGRINNLKVNKFNPENPYTSPLVPNSVDQYINVKK
jgi:hypothetical protein